DLSNHAHTRLDHIGYTPTVVTGNGAQGYPPNAPYDAILATCALRRIPADWLAQAAPGARIVTPLATASSHSTSPAQIRPAAGSSRPAGSSCPSETPTSRTSPPHRHTAPDATPAPPN
ncbi:MAG: protein-L-isoaspartate O-methyltransferase family protein, partial [Pseudonocardiaceae bacterium]